MKFQSAAKRSASQRARGANNMQLFAITPDSRSSFVNDFTLFLCICATKTAIAYACTMHIHA